MAKLGERHIYIWLNPEGGEEEEEREEGVIRAALTFASAGEEGHEPPQDIKEKSRKFYRMFTI